MAQTSGKKKTNTKPKGSAAAKKAPVNSSVSREATAIVFGFLALLTVVGIFNDDGFVISGICSLVKGLFGYGFWVCPVVFVLVAIIQGFAKDGKIAWRTTAALLIPLLVGAVADLLFSDVPLQRAASFGAVLKSFYLGGLEISCGGVLGGLLAYGCEMAFAVYGAAIILFLLLVFFVMSACNVTVKKLVSGIKSLERVEYAGDPEPEPAPKERRKKTGPAPVAETQEKTRRKPGPIDIPLDDEPAFDELTVGDETKKAEEKQSANLFTAKPKKGKTPKPAGTHAVDVEPLSIEEAEMIAGVSPTVTLSGKGSTRAAEISSELPKKPDAAAIAAETAAISVEIEELQTDTGYEKPPIFLLKKGHANTDNADEELRTNRERLESTVKSFGVNARIVGLIHGPTVTRYDLELEQGVKLSRLTNLAGDIALALGVVNVRIAPIPNKISTVGIEVPNKQVSTVYLRDIIDSPKFVSSKSALTFAIGKDIGGDPVIGNISKLPHLLIAGTTGSGKSVCMNSLIISLLYKSDPEDVRLIMIDPKMVEMGVYNGIPHLYIPVVTDPKKAAGALQWAVTEMLKRYRLFSETGVRSLSSYNSYLVQNGQPKLPNVVVVIDELADLMLVASKDVEESICRVAQMGRAAGMHLIIATQRPSADVITGLMKANIPSRIAFAVSSGLESRIILDSLGAEKLVGYGDMLYFPIGAGKPLRVQGAFVSDEERDQIVEFIKSQSTADYAEDVMAQIEKAAEEKNSGGRNAEPDTQPGGDYDELLPQAVDVIFDTKQASVSMLQRRLKLGYSRAARIIDQIEEMGIVGPSEGSKPRQILITHEQWMEMQLTNGTAPTETIQLEEFDNEVF